MQEALAPRAGAGRSGTRRTRAALCGGRRSSTRRGERRLQAAARARWSSKNGEGSSASPMRRCARLRGDALASIERRELFTRIVGDLMYGAEPRQRAAAGGARPRHHLRPDGRDQHGARRDADARRLRDLRGAARVPAVRCPDALRLVPGCSRCPSAFCVCACVGMVLERRVLRFLYGRPLETLLATWGISLGLIQTVRLIFGAQNVAVANPSWLSGGYELLHGVVLPYNRIATIVLRGLGRALRVATCSTRTRLGLARARGHAEPRAWRRCMGIAPRASTCGPSASARAWRASAASRSRRSATWAPSSGRATSSTRSWSWCSAASASSPARCARLVRPRHRQQAARADLGRGARQDHRARRSSSCSFNATPGHLRAQGPRGGGLSHDAHPRSLLEHALAQAVAGSRAPRCSRVVIVPVLHPALPADSPLHVPSYLVPLLGKFVCFALVALAIDLIWGYHRAS